MLVLYAINDPFQQLGPLPPVRCQLLGWSLQEPWPWHGLRKTQNATNTPVLCHGLGLLVCLGLGQQLAPLAVKYACIAVFPIPVVVCV